MILACRALERNAMPDIRIRPLTAADEPAWRTLWTDYLAFYETSQPEAVYASNFARMLGSERREFRCLIAEVDGQPVGLAHYHFHRTCWSLADVCYLQDLFVDPAARGTGLGLRLIEAVYAAADAEGAPDVYWITQEFNRTARQLYDRVAVLAPFVLYERRT